MCDPGGAGAERVGPSCSGVVAELLLVHAPAAATAPQLEAALSVTGLSWFLSWSSWFLDTVHRISLEILFPEQSSWNCRSVLERIIFPPD